MITDGAGRVTQTTDALGHTTNASYNSLNQLTSITDAKQGLTQFNFDEALTPLARTDLQSALSLAQSITPKDLSILAQLAACRATLTKPRPKPPAEDKPTTKDATPTRTSAPREPARP